MRVPTLHGNLHTPGGTTTRPGVGSAIHFRLVGNFTSKPVSPFYRPELKPRGRASIRCSRRGRDHARTPAGTSTLQTYLPFASLHRSIHVCIMGRAGNTLREEGTLQPVPSRRQRHCDEPLPSSGGGRLTLPSRAPKAARQQRRPQACPGETRVTCPALGSMPGGALDNCGHLKLDFHSQAFTHSPLQTNTMKYSISFPRYPHGENT